MRHLRSGSRLRFPFWAVGWSAPDPHSHPARRPLIGFMVLALPIVLMTVSCHSDTATKPGPPDTTPPAAVSDLGAHSGNNGVVLTWTAPGNDGMQGRATKYDLRYYKHRLTIQAWDSATVVTSVPAPKPAGQQESFTVSGLSAGTWWFRLRTADAVPNWSALSNMVSAAVGDTIPPGQVTDLSAVSSTATTVTLSWTSPGNDGTTGTASQYDLRYATTSITEQTWAAAIRVADLPAPQPAGSKQSFTVTGLSLGFYYFALKTADGAGNWSVLSNAAADSTESPTPVRLTTSTQPIGATDPDWSPDGLNIAFAADFDIQYQSQIYLVPASGGTPVKLTNSTLLPAVPRWSPDGTEIAYLTDESQFPYDTWSVVYMTPIPGANPTTVVAINNNESLSGLVWAADGGRIAYSVITDVHMDSEIRVCPLSGGAAQTVITGSQNVVSDWPGTLGRIALYSTRGGSSFQIWTVKDDGSETTQLVQDSWNDEDPRWSPDGKQIAFASDRSGHSHIWIMTSDGKNPTQVTFDPGEDYFPTWSPDGTKVAYQHDDVWTSPRDIWVIRVK